MANSIGKVSIELEAKFAKLETDVKRAVGSMEREFSRFRTDASKHFSKVEAAADKTGAHLDKFSKRAKQAFDIGISATTFRMMQGLVDGYANLSAKVRLASGANASFAASMGAVRKVADKTYASLEATAGLVQKISQSLQNTGMSASASFQQAIKLTEVFNKALVVSGAGTIQAQAAMLQFSQAIAKGKLDGDEFRSVMENNSRFMLLLADSLGVTFGQLYKMREEGKLTNEMLMRVTENAGRLDEEFSKFPITIGRAGQLLHNAMLDYVGATDQAVGASRALASVIKVIAENFATIGNMAVFVGGIYAAVKAVSLLTSSVKAMGAAYASGKIYDSVVADLDAGIKKEIGLLAQKSAAEAQAKAQTIANAIASTEAVRASVQQRIALSKMAITSAEAELASQRKAYAAASSSYFSPATLRVMEESMAAQAKTVQRLKLEQTALVVMNEKVGETWRKQNALASSLSATNATLAAAQARVAASQKTAATSTTLLAGAWSGAKAIGTGLLTLLGGWPGLIAAAAAATYMLSQRESEMEATYRRSSEAIKEYIAAKTRLAQFEAAQDVIKEVKAQYDLVQSYRQSYQSAVAFAEAVEASGQNVLENSDALIMAQASVASWAEKTSDAKDQLERMGLEAKDAGIDVGVVTERTHGLGVIMQDVKTFVLDFAASLKTAGQATTELGTPLKDLNADLLKQAENLRERNAELKGGIGAVIAMKVAQSDWAGATPEIRKETSKLVEEILRLTHENDGLTQANKDSAKGFKEAEKAANEHEKALEESKKTVLDLKDRIMEIQAEALGPIAKIERQAMDAAMDFADALVEAGGDVKLLTAFMTALIAKKNQDIAATEAQIAADEERADVMGRIQAAYAEERQTFGLRGRELFIQTEIQRALNDAIHAGKELTQDEISVIEAWAGAHYDAGVAAENFLSIIENYEDTVINALQGVGDAFGNMFSEIIKGNLDIEDAFENLGDTLVDIIADSVGQMLSEFLKLQIINPILNSMFDGFGGSVLPTQGNLLGNITSMFGGGGGSGGIMGWIGSLFGGGASGGAGGLGLAGLGGTLGTWGGFTGYSAAGAASANLGSIGLGMTAPGAPLAGGAASVGTASGAASAGGMSGFMGIPVVGWIMAGMALNDSLFSQGWRPGGGSLTLPNGQQVTGGGSSGGRVIDRLGILSNPLAGLFGDRALSLFSGSAVFTRLFGRKKPELQSGTTTMTLGAGGPGGSESYRTIERGGLFRSDRRRTHRFDLGEEAQAAVEQLFEDVQAVMENAARMMQGEAPEMIDAALRTVMEYDKDGKVKSTKYFVDVLGRSWEEATAEAATTRITAEAMIATIDSILGTTVAAAEEAIGTAGGDAIAGGAEEAVRRANETVDFIVKSAMESGEASAIAERWRDDAETLMEGAQFLLMAATDIRAGVGLLGEGGTLTQITDLIEELQNAGETLSETYARVVQSTNLLSDALELSGVTLDMAREEFVRFATDITEAAGGLERATQLWNSYFETFFTASERAELARARAQSRAESQFSDIGLNVNDFLGEGGLAAFRAAFEAAMPTLDASGYVEWLEAAEALGILDAAIAALAETAGEAGSSGALAEALVEFMGPIKEELASFAPPQTFEQRLAGINAEIAAMIERAMALGATEYQINTIRELGQHRINALLEEQAATLQAQAQASHDLRSYLMELEALSTGSGISPLTEQLMRLRQEYQQHIDRINELAIASGRASASQGELAIASNWYAAQLRMVAESLVESGMSLVQRLYGGAASAGSIGTGSTWMGGGTYGGSTIGDVAEAVEDRYAREMELLKNLSDYLESLGLSNLSPLTPSERLAEAESQYQSILMRAMGGDLDALGQLQGAANTYLGEAQSYYGGVGPYSGIFANVQSQIQALIDRGPLNSPLEQPPTEVTGVGGGGVQVEAGESFAELSELDRMAIAGELTTVLRDLIVLTGQSLLEVSQQLGLDLRAYVTDLGVNLDELSDQTAMALTDVARSLGIDLTELASGVGVSLGSLADAQSLLNNALESTINSLPVEFRDRLRGYLEAIENATTEADANQAIADAEAAINLLPADIRDALAPFFEGVASPADPLLAEAVATTANTAAMTGLQTYTNQLLGEIKAVLLNEPPLGTGGGGGQMAPPTIESVAAIVTQELSAPGAATMSVTEEIASLRSEITSLKTAIISASKDNVGGLSNVERAVKAAGSDQPRKR